MLVTDIFKALESLEVSENRCVLETYAEVVFSKSDIDAWTQQLVQILGEPQKAPGQNPTERDMALTKDFRGIRRDQTLFYKEFDGYGILAMFWPWAAGNVTLIVAKVVEKL